MIQPGEAKIRDSVGDENPADPKEHREVVTDPIPSYANRPAWMQGIGNPENYQLLPDFVKLSPVLQGSLHTYTLQSCIGEGGIAIVFKVVDEDGNQWAAKIDKKRQESEGKRPLNATDKLLDEAQTIAQIRAKTSRATTECARPVSLTESFTRDGVVVMVTELLNSDWQLTTVAKLRQQPPLPLALKSATQILTFIDTLHKADITYDDFKLENLWLKPDDERVVVSDLNVMGNGVTQERRVADTVRACGYVLHLFPDYTNVSFFAEGEDLLHQPQFEALPLELQSILTTGFQQASTLPLPELCQRLDSLAKVAEGLWIRNWSRNKETLDVLETGIRGNVTDQAKLKKQTEQYLSYVDIIRSRLNSELAKEQAGEHQAELCAVEHRVLHQVPTYAVRYLASTNTERVATAQSGLNNWSANQEKTAIAQEIQSWIESHKTKFPHQVEALVTDLTERQFATGDVVYTILTNEQLKTQEPLAWFVCRYLTGQFQTHPNEVAQETDHLFVLITQLRSLSEQSYTSRLLLLKQLQEATMAFSRTDQDLFWLFSQIRVRELPDLLAGLEVLQSQPIGAVEAFFMVNQYKKEVAVMDAIAKDAPAWQLHSVARVMDPIDRRLTQYPFGVLQQAEVVQIMNVENSSLLITGDDEKFENVLSLLMGNSQQTALSQLGELVDGGQLGANRLAGFLWKNMLLHPQGGARKLGLEQIVLLAKTIEEKQLSLALQSDPNVWTQLPELEAGEIRQLQQSQELLGQERQRVVAQQLLLEDEERALGAKLTALNQVKPSERRERELRLTLEVDAVIQALSQHSALAITELTSIALQRIASQIRPETVIDEEIVGKRESLNSENVSEARNGQWRHIQDVLQRHLVPAGQVLNDEAFTFAELTAEEMTLISDRVRQFQQWFSNYQAEQSRLPIIARDSQQLTETIVNGRIEAIISYVSDQLRQVQRGRQSLAESIALLEEEKAAAVWLEEWCQRLSTQIGEQMTFQALPVALQRSVDQQRQYFMESSLVGSAQTELQIIDQIATSQTELGDVKKNRNDIAAKLEQISKDEQKLDLMADGIRQRVQAQRKEEFARQNGFWADSLANLVECWQSYEGERAKQPPSFPRTREIALRSRELLGGLKHYARAMTESLFPNFGDFLEDVAVFVAADEVADGTHPDQHEKNIDTVATQLGRDKRQRDARLEVWQHGNKELAQSPDTAKVALYRVYQLSNQYFFQEPQAVLPRYYVGQVQATANQLHTEVGKKGSLVQQLNSAARNLSGVNDLFQEVQPGQEPKGLQYSLTTLRRKVDALALQVSSPILDVCAQYPAAVRQPARPQWDIQRKDYVPVPHQRHGKFEDWLREQVVIECVLMAASDSAEITDAEMMDLFAKYDVKLTSDMLQLLVSRGGNQIGEISPEQLQAMEQQARNLPDAVRRLASALVASETPPDLNPPLPTPEPLPPPAPELSPWHSQLTESLTPLRPSKLEAAQRELWADPSLITDLPLRAKVLAYQDQRQKLDAYLQRMSAAEQQAFKTKNAALLLEQDGIGELLEQELTRYLHKSALSELAAGVATQLEERDSPLKESIPNPATKADVTAALHQLQQLLEQTNPAVQHSLLLQTCTNLLLTIGNYLPTFIQSDSVRSLPAEKRKQYERYLTFRTQAAEISPTDPRYPRVRELMEQQHTALLTLILPKIPNLAQLLSQVAERGGK